MAVAESRRALTENAVAGDTLAEIGPAGDEFFGSFSLGDVAVIFAENFFLLLLGLLLMALMAFGIASALPEKYTSSAYLAIDDAAARSAEALMRSPAVAEKVLSKHTGTGDTPEARRRFIDKNLRIAVTQGDRRVASIFRLELTYSDPGLAQTINSQLIDGWLETTEPGPSRRARIEEEIDRIERQVKLVSNLAERLQQDATNLITPHTIQGELATPIASLIARRDQSLAEIVGLKNQLRGTSRDVIIAPSDLPQEPSWPRKGITTALIVVAAFPLLLLFIVGRHFAAQLNAMPGRASKWGAVRAAFRRPFASNRDRKEERKHT